MDKFNITDRKNWQHQILFLSYLLSLVSAAIIYFTGGTHRVYPQLMYFPITLAAVTNSKKQALLQALVSGILIGPFMPLNVETGVMQSPQNWLIRTLIFIAVALVISSFVDYYLQEHKHKERIKSELKVANKIQASMLPRIFPPFPNRDEFDIYASMTPAKEVGGDFYDFYMLEDDKVAIVIGDVSGKGVPAALFMVITKTLIKNEAQRNIPPEEIFYNVNNALCRDNEELLFVTAFLGILDLKKGKLEYVNAGHNPPLVRLQEKEEEFEFLELESGFVLGGMADFPYQREEISFQPGDMIYIYTDGITEAMNAEREQFSEQRLLDTLSKLNSPDLQVAEIEHKIKLEVNGFTGEEPQYDDYTMVILHLREKTAENIGKVGS